MQYLPISHEVHVSTVGNWWGNKYGPPVSGDAPWKWLPLSYEAHVRTVDMRWAKIYQLSVLGKAIYNDYLRRLRQNKRNVDILWGTHARAVGMLWGTRVWTVAIGWGNMKDCRYLVRQNIKSVSICWVTNYGLPISDRARYMICWNPPCWI
jgi:hypothetical protein